MHGATMTRVKCDGAEEGADASEVDAGDAARGKVGGEAATMVSDDATVTDDESASLMLASVPVAGAS